MPNLTGILAGLSGLPQGYMQGAQFAQQQDYRQILAEMARAQMQDRLQKIAAQGTAFQSLLSPDNPATPPGGVVGSQTSPLAPPPVASTSPAPSLASPGGFPPQVAQSLVPIINRDESGNRNIPNQQGPGGTPASTASGPAQITDPTWRDVAPAVGGSAYPRAMAAPPAVQNAATQGLLETRGLKPWQSNPKVVQDIHAALGGAPADAAAKPVAQSVASGLPQGVQGRMSLQALAQMIEQRAPQGTPDNVKFMALAQLSSLLAPSEKEQLQLQMMQFRQQNAEQLAQFRAGLSADLRGTETPYQQQNLAERNRHDLVQEAAADKRVQETATKAQQKSKEQAGDLTSMADEATALAKIVEQHPEYVGARGKFGGLISGLAEQAHLTNQDPEKVNFRARLDQFQARAMKALTNTRYFSGVAQSRMNQLLPGLGVLDNPTLVIQHLNNAAQTMRQESEGLAGTGAVTPPPAGEQILHYDASGNRVQ